MDSSLYQTHFLQIVWLHPAAACHWCGWLNSFGLNIVSIITTAYAQDLPPITAAANLVLNLFLATEIMFTTNYWKRGEKELFPRTFTTALQRDSMVSLCFGFDSRCFPFFPLCLTFLGKPAVLISDIDVSRAPWSLWVNRLTEKFPNFILICSEIRQKTISYCCRIIQSKHLHSLHFQRPAAPGPE